MNTKTIKYFLTICEKDSFTKAAAAQGISQPSLSLAIQRLERELGWRPVSSHRPCCGLDGAGKQPAANFQEAREVC
jgi:hypothetical protein